MVTKRSRRSLGCTLGLVCTLALAGCRPSPPAQAPANATEPSHAAPAADAGLVIVNPFGDRPTFFDFGDVGFGQKIEHVFQLKNADPDPVSIQDMLPSCGCTVARIAYTDAQGKEVLGSIAPGARVIVLPPGVVARLTLSVDTTRVESMNRDKLTQVRVRSDSKNTPYLTLEMHLLVRRAFRSVPERIDLGETPQSYGKSGRADITVEEPASQAKIRGILSVEGPFTATVDSTTIQGAEVFILAVSVKPNLPIGPAYGRVTMTTTKDDGSGEGAPFYVPLSAQIAPEVVVRPALFPLKSAKSGEDLVARAELAALVPGERVHVKGTSAKGVGAESLKIECTPTAPDEQGRATQWQVVVSAPPNAKEKAFAGTVTIELDHPRVPKIDVSYSAR